MKKHLSILATVIFSLGFIFYSESCRKIKYVESTSTTLNIYGYLKANPDKYSLISQIVDKSGYAGFLNAYGSYTMFVPTDTAVKIYMAKISKDISALSVADAQDIVKIHLLQDTLPTSSFVDGKLPTPTQYGQYLVTATVTTNGISAILVNRQGTITQANIKTGNGLIHQIDHVLEPARQSIADLITADSRFTIFKQALQATGYWDTISKVNSLDTALRKWYTVLAETNQAIADSGMFSYADLKAKLSNTGNPLNPLDSLNIFVKYHIIPSLNYLADLASASSFPTLAPLEVLATKLVDVNVLINDLDFNGVHEQGIQLERSTSDLSATTGVLHTALAHFAPKIRQPTAVYWDVADFPEVRKLPAVFRRGNFSFAYGAIKDITWNNPLNTMDYAFANTTGTGTVNPYYGDYLSVPMGNTSRHNWIQFRTPILIKGRYKVWVCYRAAKGSGTVGLPGGSNMPVQTSFDGVDLSRQFNFCEQRPNLSDGELDALGWKKYSTTTNQLMTGKFLGIIDIPTTDRHILNIRSLPAAGTGNPSDYLDMFHFIPINQIQYLPRFAPDGTLQYF